MVRRSWNGCIESTIPIEITALSSTVPSQEFQQTVYVDVLANETPYSNSSNPVDANGDNQIIPLDVLLVINAIVRQNNAGSSTPQGEYISRRESAAQDGSVPQGESSAWDRSLGWDGNSTDRADPEREVEDALLRIDVGLSGPPRPAARPGNGPYSDHVFTVLGEQTEANIDVLQICY